VKVYFAKFSQKYLLYHNIRKHLSDVDGGGNWMEKRMQEFDEFPTARLMTFVTQAYSLRTGN